MGKGSLESKMGTWGPGNFDSDKACDYLASIIDRLVETIEESLSDKPQNHYFDGELGRGETRLMPSIDILITLCQHYKTSAGVDAPEVVEWKEKYLQFYDKHIDDYGAKGKYKENRRKVIEDTFNALETLALDWESLGKE